jgi:hypothetical protein
MEDAKTKFYRLNPEKREEFPAVDFARSRTCRLIERENAALREVLTRWKEICEMGLPDVVMPSLKPALVELWDATDAAINAARKEGGAT